MCSCSPLVRSAIGRRQQEQQIYLSTTTIMLMPLLAGQSAGFSFKQSECGGGSGSPSLSNNNKSLNQSYLRPSQSGCRQGAAGRLIEVFARCFSPPPPPPREKTRLYRPICFLRKISPTVSRRSRARLRLAASAMCVSLGYGNQLRAD